MSRDLDDRHLGIILQASVDRAKELLETAGGFIPFGARARSDGAVEFLEAQGRGEGDTLDSLYRRIGAILADEAGRGEILAATLVANARHPDGAADYPSVIAVQVEAAGFCRSILVPYRIADGQADLGRMLPEEAAPMVFAG